MTCESPHRGLLDVAADFHKRRPWVRWSNFHYFAVEVPGVGDPIFGVVMGQAGEQFGLSLFRGPGALRHVLAVMDPRGPDDDAMEDMDYLAFNMDYPGELTPDAKDLLRKARYDEKTSGRVPSFMTKPPGRRPRRPNEEELRQLQYVLRGVLTADGRGDFEPRVGDPEDGVLTLTVTGEPEAPEVAVEVVPYEVSGEPTAIPFPAAAPDIAALPRVDATWLIGLSTMAGVIDGDDRSVCLLLMVDDESEAILQARPVMGRDLREAAEVVLEAIRGRNAAGRGGLPREVLFTSQKLHDTLAAALRAAGVICTYRPSIPKLQRITEVLGKHLGDDAPPADLDGPLPAPPPPAAEDLAGWKKVDERLSGRLARQLDVNDGLWSSRAAKRYFRDEDIENFFKEYGQSGAVQAYVEWAVLDYRPTKKSKTCAEKMLAEHLPEAEATLLRARMNAHPSLYRIDSHDSGAGTVTLEDVLLGERVTVHDQLMSENIEDGIFVPGRAFAAGNFHFLVPAGPPIGRLMGMEAVEFLHNSGVETTPEGLRLDAHKFGWLWDWLDARQADSTPPRVCNTDGHDLLWHTASFHVDDERQIRAALLGREDVDYDDEADEFSWSRDVTANAEVAGDFVRLGRIELVGDEMVLTVNSAERFAEARGWLEQIPGVAYQNVTVRPWDVEPEDRPMDDRIGSDEPEELTLEMVTAAREVLTRHYMGWLDMALPVLGGKTPRDTCRTEAGRRKVASMIRTMPDPMGDADVEVPRQAMLRELGIEDIAGAPMPKAQPRRAESDPVAPRTKVGRNAPCPCGSGKKYKKCCGR